MPFKAIEEAKNEAVKIIKSGVPAVHLCGDDYAQMDQFVEELAKELQYEVSEWNFGYGLVDFKTKRAEAETSYDEFLGYLCTNPEFRKQKLALIKNAAFALEGEANAKNLARLQQTLLFIKNNGQKTALVYCDEKQFIPDQLVSLVHFVELKPPEKEELETIARNEIDANGIQFAETARLAAICKGMSEDAFKRILKQAALEKDTFAQKVIEVAQKAKKQAVGKSRLLELVETDTGEDDIGGLAHMKWWLGEKKNAIFNAGEADEHGVKPAKGIMLVGMPGCGKSLSAKAIANKYEIPLLRLDLGTLMGKYLGQSEEQLRRALRLAENASPCVLWVDEIEKAFAGVSGDETGVTQRLFGYLLTWLNDKTATVFVVATANDIAVLPPEFMRRGRFDEIFSVDFPTEPERKQIFTIHIKKALKRRQEKGFDVKAFLDKTDAGLDDLAKETEGYAGSDIASLVNDAMETAWNDMRKTGKPFNEVIDDQLIQTLKTQLKYIKPLKEVLSAKIEINRKKFGEYKLTSASFNEQSYDVDSRLTASLESRKRVAADPRCPPTYLERLAADNDREVLLALAANPNCPFETIARLKDNPDEEVKKAAMEKYVRSEAGIIETAKNGTRERKLELPSLPSIPDAALEALAQDPDIDVAAEVLRYKFLPEAVLNLLAERAGRDEALAEKLKAHPNCPPGIKEKLERTCEKCRYCGKGGRGQMCKKALTKPSKGACDFFERKGHESCESCNRATNKGHGRYYCPLDYNNHLASDVCSRYH
jgi:SpoVK/Ycf46/Vps4 family AAA+-type ATPase